jgi:hypothetical protein
MVPLHGLQIVEVLHESLKGSPGFGLRQSSGALARSSTYRKRQWAAAVRDAVAPTPIPGGFMAPVRVRIVEDPPTQRSGSRSQCLRKNARRPA